MRKVYRDRVLAAAREQGLTAAQVRKLKYSQIATMAGVDTGVQNPEFFYVSVRKFVAQVLERDAQAVTQEERRALTETAIRTLAGHGQAIVKIDADGKLDIDNTLSVQGAG